MKYMKGNKKNNLFSIILLLLGILIAFILFYIKKDFNIEDNWISVSEIQTGTNFKEIDGEYLYCNSYNNIKKDKLKSVIINLTFSCIIISLSMGFILLLKKLKIEQLKNYRINTLLHSKREKTNEIVSKFSNDEYEIKAQQILNDDFKKNAYNMLCNLQIAFMNSDYKTLQNLLTKDLYNKYCTGLATLKLKSRNYIVNDFELIRVKYVDIYEENYKYVINIYVKIKYYGYIIDTKTNEIIRGSKDEKITNTYMLSLVKYKNTNNWLIAEKNNIGETE